MSPAETTARLRRLADDWRKEERQLCEQFGNEIIPHSMRARRIKDTKALGAAVEMIERLERVEKALAELIDDLEVRARWDREAIQGVVSCGASVYRNAKAALEKSK